MQGRPTFFIQVLWGVVAILLLARTASAQADILTPELTSRIHCTLLLNSVTPYPVAVPILKGKIETFVGGKSAASDQLIAYLERTEWLPDFGFLVGSRWESMSLSERNRFNRIFTLYLGSHYALRDYAQSNCAMHATIQGQPHEGDPQRRTLSMRAVVYTQLIRQDSRIAMIYDYNFIPEHGWILTDIALQDRALTEAYRGKINQWIAEKGTRNLELTLEPLTRR